MTETLTPSRLWKHMTPEQRQGAARAFRSDADAKAGQLQAVMLIAQQKKFRPKTVNALEPDRKAPHGDTSPHAAVAARPPRGAGARRVPPRRAAPDDGRLPRRARHRARKRIDSGGQRQAGGVEDRARGRGDRRELSPRRRAAVSRDAPLSGSGNVGRLRAGPGAAVGLR